MWVFVSFEINFQTIQQRNTFVLTNNRWNRLFHLGRQGILPNFLMTFERGSMGVEGWAQRTVSVCVEDLPGRDCVPSWRALSSWSILCSDQAWIAAFWSFLPGVRTEAFMKGQKNSRKDQRVSWAAAGSTPTSHQKSGLVFEGEARLINVLLFLCFI